MLQKINFVLMIVVLLAVIGVSVQMFITQRYNTLAIQQLSAQMTEQAMERTAAERDAVSTVTVEGDVARPGWFEVGDKPGEETYLHEILQQAGVKDDSSVRFRFNDMMHERKAEELLSASATPILVKPGDRITVTKSRPVADGQNRRPDPTGFTEEEEARLIGVWNQIDADGQFVDNGMTVAFLGIDDVRNLERTAFGQLSMPNLEHRLGLAPTRDHRSADDLTGHLRVYGSLDSPALDHEGRWVLGHDKLTLNLAAVPGAPLGSDETVFRKLRDVVEAADLQPHAEFNAIRREAVRRLRDEAAAERTRAIVLQDFVFQLLTSQDPAAGHELAVKDVLDAAAGQLDDQIVNDPEVEAKIRQAIEAAKRQIDTPK